MLKDPFFSSYITALKKVFAESKEIQKLADQFVLLNLVVSIPSPPSTSLGPMSDLLFPCVSVLLH